MMYGQEFDVPEDIDWVVPIGKAKVRPSGQGRHHHPLTRGWSAWR
jgi:pyruvate/2-oxoglutarate/acetoin dehydrogenase E1 component